MIHEAEVAVDSRVVVVAEAVVEADNKLMIGIVVEVVVVAVVVDRMWTKNVVAVVVE